MAHKGSVAPDSSRVDVILILLILVLPAIFFHWALPFISATTVGNDYMLFSIPQQMELQFSIVNGTFPLYVPGFAGGQSAQALMLGQAYHPLTLLASHMPGYWIGFAVECNTLLRLLSLGFAHLALFIFLRRLGLGRGFAFMLAMVTTYNMRMLDLFRYGAALESWTGHLFLCAFIGLYYLKRSSLWARGGIIASTYWLLTCGHPQMAYYGVLGTVLFTLLLPFLAAFVDPEKRIPKGGIARFWARTTGIFAIGVLLSAAFIVPFATEFFAGNPRSAAGQDFAWALALQDSLLGTLNNLFLPLRSDVHGAFGASSLVLLVAFLPALLLLRMRIPAVVWTTWALVVVVFLALQGDRTPVYWVLWRYLPLVSSGRASGRLSMLLPILLMSLLAWLFGHIERSVHPAESHAHREVSTILAVAGLLASIVYLAIFSRVSFTPSVYSPVSIHPVSHLTETVAVALGLVTLILFAIYTRLPGWQGGLVAAMCFCTCGQSKLVLDNGTWKDRIGETPTFSEMANQKKERLRYRFASGEGMFSPVLWRQTSIFHVEPSLGRIYFQWRMARDMEDAYRLLGQGVTPEEVIVEGADNEALPLPPGTDNPQARTKLVESSFNRLVFDVESSHSAFFTLSYPYTGHWIAIVNGVSATPRRANGGNHAVPIPSGHSTVEFRYRSPGQLVGWALSCVALVLAAFILVFPENGRKRALLCSLVIAAASSLMFAWLHHSLYTGKNLQTMYTWSGPEPAGTRPNLAYGRRTTMSSAFQIKHNCCPFVGSKGTDGDRSRMSGFMTEEEELPLWGVDLGQVQTIGSVVAHESRQGPDWNRRPLSVATSLDGRTWSQAGGEFIQGADALVFDLVSPITARYVAVRAAGRCRLSLDEVEIFPPKY